MKTLYCLLFALSFCIQQPFRAQEVKELFRADSKLHLDLTLPLKEVISDLQEKKEHQATLAYRDDQGQEMVFNVKVSTRGKTRKQICAFPPLKLNFKRKEVSESIFKGQNKIKLVTHCKKSKNFEKYLEKEYAVYKLYQHVVPYSFEVRLVEINYIDSHHPGDSNVHLAFMIEQIKDLAKRNQMEEFKGEIPNQEVLDKDKLDKMVMFEFLIGNLDWSIPDRHNVKLIKDSKKGLPVAVPYDFDYSGMVNTPYAVPPEGLGVKSVRSRKFRGLCRPQGYTETISFYLGIKTQLYEEWETADYLSPQSREELISYLDSFYQLITDSQSVRTQIDRACRAKHKHIYEYN